MSESIKKMWYIYNGILFSHEKGNLAIYNNMNEAAVHYAQ